MCLMLFGFVLSLSLGASLVPFGSIFNTVLIIIAVFGFISLFLIVRKKKAAAIIPTTVLKDRNTLVFSISHFFVSIAGLPITFLLPMFMLYVLGTSAMEAGLAWRFALAGRGFRPTGIRFRQRTWNVQRLGPSQPALLDFCL